MKSVSGDHDCKLCQDRQGNAFRAPFTVAFQPIFDVTTGTVYAQEALLRGMQGQSAESILSELTPDNRYNFDQRCRVTAIRRAAELGIESSISINFMPNAIYEPKNCIRTTLAAARHHRFPHTNIIFEFLETEAIDDIGFVKRIVEEYRELGFRTALDDFGEGHAGLNHIIDLEPDIVKLDKNVARGLHLDIRRRAVVRSMIALCQDLDILLIAEGVEDIAELEALCELGVTHFQGYLLGEPQMDRILTSPVLPVK